MNVTLYHNPRCSKSRETLALLNQHGATVHVVEYLATPPTADTLRTLARQLGVAPRDMMRSGEAPYRELGLGDDSVDDDALFHAITKHPILLQRPIAVVGDRAAIGRPPEAVLDLLG